MGEVRGGEGQKKRDGLAEEGLFPVLFSYTSPAERPEIYTFERWYDMGHLTREGAAD